MFWGTSSSISMVITSGQLLSLSQVLLMMCTSIVLHSSSFFIWSWRFASQRISDRYLSFSSAVGRVKTATENVELAAHLKASKNCQTVHSLKNFLCLRFILVKFLLPGYKMVLSESMISSELWASSRRAKPSKKAMSLSKVKIETIVIRESMLLQVKTSGNRFRQQKVRSVSMKKTCVPARALWKANEQTRCDFPLSCGPQTSIVPSEGSLPKSSFNLHEATSLTLIFAFL